MKIRIAIGCVLLLSCLGCSDIFKEEQLSVVGNIFLINSQNQEDVGYKMVFYENGINNNVLNDYVVNVSGDDTVLLVQCVSKSDCISRLYYKVSHNNGNGPVSASLISEDAYSKALNSQKHTYHIHFDTPVCN